MITFLLGLYVVEGLFLAGLSVPLIMRKIGPNAWYGFRVRKTLEDPAVWYPVNAFAAKGLLGVGLATCTTAVVLYFVPGITLAAYALTVAVIILGGLALSVLLSFRYLKTFTDRSLGPPP